MYPPFYISKDVPCSICIYIHPITETMRNNKVYPLFYGVATISRILQIIGLFCKRALQKRHLYSAYF